MLLKTITDYDGIYLACGVTDLRKAVDGLANIVKRDFEIDPFGNYLFLFCNRARNRMKCLTWDKNGFWLCYKRLDGAGAKFQWPNPVAWVSSSRSERPASAEAVRGIKIAQLRLLLDGLSVDPPKGFGEVSARDF